MIIFSFVGVCAVTMTLYQSLITICAGRVIFGICGGVYTVAFPRMVEETVPPRMVGTFGAVTNLAVNAGELVAILLGMILPSIRDNRAEAETTSAWRIIYGAPLIFYSIQLLLFFTIIRYDSIKFLMDRN